MTTPEHHPLVPGVLASIIRTIVPAVVGVILGALANHGFDLPEGSLTEVITLVLTTAYYGLIRLLETYVGPAWGWLIGYAKAPAYPQTAPTPPPA